MSKPKPIRSKRQLLIQRVLVETGMMLAVIAAIGGGTYFLSGMVEEREQARLALSSQIGGLASKTQQLHVQYGKAQESMPVYQEITKKKEGAGFTLNRQLAKEKLAELQMRHHLRSMRIGMGAIQELPDAKYKRKTFSVVGSEITLNFEAFSDEHVFALIEDIRSEFSGFIKVTRLTLTRTEKLTNELLLLISEKGTAANVRGELRFDWLGFKTAGEENKGEPKPGSGAAP